MKTYQDLNTIKRGKRFDWHLVLDQVFIRSLTATVLKNIHRTQSPRGVTKDQSDKRDNYHQTIPMHLLSARCYTHGVFSSDSSPTPAVRMRLFITISRNQLDSYSLEVICPCMGGSMEVGGSRFPPKTGNTGPISL